MALEVQVFSIDFFENINSYKANLTISQVIKFFEKYNISIPKTTIQNFVRNEVVSEVVDKRYYTKQHLLEIIVALGYREVFDLSTIKTLNKILEKECEKTSVEEVFYNIFNVNKSVLQNNENIIDTLNNSIKVSYLETIAIMTKSVFFKKVALEKLNN